MEKTKYNIQMLLMQTEYQKAIRLALESRIRVGLFKKDKHMQTLLDGYSKGETTIDDAAEILMTVLNILQNGRPNSLASLGGYAILRGASDTLSFVIKALMEKEEEFPDLPKSDIQIKALDRIMELRFH